MYTHPYNEIELASAADCTSTGEKGDFVPGLNPVTVRSLAAVVEVASATTTNCVITFYRNTAGTVTTTNRTTIDTITIPGGTAPGSVYYVDGLDVDVSPGQEVQATVTTAATTTGTNSIKMKVDPSFERPANDTNMTESA